MKISNKIFFICLIIIFACTVSLIKPTRAFFTDTISMSGNTFTTGFWSATPSPSPSISPSPATSPSPSPSPIETASVVINEIFIDGGSQYEWVEIYNPTNTEINLTGWKIADGNSEDVLPSVSPLPANNFAVIITSNSLVTGIPSGAITIKLEDSEIGSGLNETGDTVTLKNSSGDVDQVTYGNSTDLNSGKTYSRISDGVDTDSDSDWHTADPTIGTTNL